MINIVALAVTITAHFRILKLLSYLRPKSADFLASEENLNKFY